jgi:hypothetical protein
MKFEDIFKEPGLYRAEGFADGIAFEITKEGFLYHVWYKDKGDILPERTNPTIYWGILKKDYQKVFNRQSLFQK